MSRRPLAIGLTAQALAPVVVEPFEVHGIDRVFLTLEPVARNLAQHDLDEAIAPGPLRQVNVVVLDDVLQALSRLDSRQDQIVELRFFGGLSLEETAFVLGVSPATVKRDWTTARLWLKKQLLQGSPA